MKMNKTLYAALAASLMAAALTFPVLASEKISDITMEIESGIYAGGYGDENDIDVTVDSDGCYVDSVTVTNIPSDEEWEEGDKPKIKVVLKAEDDYTFASGIGKDDIYLDEDEGTVTSVSRTTSKLTISVTLAELDEDYDDDDDYDDENLDVEDLGWDLSDGAIAYWEELDYAKRYDVRLYRDGSAVTEIISTTDTSYNFSQYFTKSGTYTFKVRGVRTSSNTGSWEESEEIEISSEDAAYIKQYGGGTTNTSSSSSDSGLSTSASAAGVWIWQEGAGWWWCNPDRSYPVSSWMELEGEWYYFDANGYCVMGAWTQINGQWYYFDASGHCVMNDWVTTSGKWYYCGSSGAMLTSQLIDGLYYVNANGEWVR